jgi:hypothetical protein
VDVTIQVGATWADIFTGLELQFGLDINNEDHLWLLHQIFLPVINRQLEFFAGAWNMHRIQHRRGRGPSRSPADMFTFDMYVHGVRGFSTGPNPQDDIDDEELELYGVDWEALRDDAILQSRATNNPTDENGTTWLGHSAPPQQLSGVLLDPPTQPEDDAIQIFDHSFQLWLNANPNASAADMWLYALSLYHTLILTI